MCSGAMEPLVDLEVVPAKIVATGIGERLDLEIVAKRADGRDTQLAYALELHNDVGQKMMPARISEKVALSAATRERRFAQSLPEALADGFYVAKATTAASDADGQEANLAAILYFAVTGGQISIIDSDEFYAKSRANFGVSP